MKSALCAALCCSALISSIAWAGSCWRDDYRQQFSAVIQLDDQVIAALEDLDYISLSLDTEDLHIYLSNVYVFSDEFISWLDAGSDSAVTLVIGPARVDTEEGWRLVLAGCCAVNWIPHGWTGREDMPGVERMEIELKLQIPDCLTDLASMIRSVLM